MSEAFPTPSSAAGCVDRFSDEARRAIYEVIALRRDVRTFRAGDEVDDDTVARILGAAHLAPSVGFSQPWGFIVVRDRERRERIRASFLRCREAESVRYPPERREQYLSYRLEGIIEAALNVCVAVDLRPREEAILGTTVQPEAVRASACCAVQNLWLAARAEGIGVGWVSIIEPAVLREELALPPGVEPIAYLCVGRPLAFRARPMLEEAGWLGRRPLADAVFRERWVAASERRRDEDAASERRRNAEDGPTAVAFPSVDIAATAADSPAQRVAFDKETSALASAHQDQLTKPRGSLGRLEEIAIWYAGATGRFPCEPPETAAVAVFAADHGVVTEAVSAYPSQVTAAMVCNMMAGGAAINVLARRHRIALTLIDVGVAGDLSGAPVDPEVALIHAKLRAGTANLYRAPAMTRAEAKGAMAVGARTADGCIDRGASILGTGEVGIGNTTAAAALACAMIGAPPSEVVGRGTGIDDATRARKVAVIEGALRRHALDPTDPIGVLAAVGGLELAAIVGFLLRALDRQVPVVLDGFLAAVSALVARGLRPDVTRLLLASHASAEQASGLVLRELGLTPLLSLGMRLGEGTGAVLGIDLVRSAVALQDEMATFATAGVRRAHR
jgi:nicotinate-nucleotide--dimethylbenzimidazole phosphoribosyltransferase